jgi:hypothetical protein
VGQAVTCPTSAPFRVRYCPICPVMDSGYLSVGSIRASPTLRERFLGHLPLEASALVAHHLPGNAVISRTLSGFPRFARGGDVVALGLLFTPGARCSQSIFRRYRPSFAPKCSCQPFLRVGADKLARAPTLKISSTLIYEASSRIHLHYP